MRKIVVLSFATVALLTFSGCGNDKKEEAAKTAQTATETAKSAVEATKEAAAKTVEAAKETVNKAAEATKEAAAGAAEKAKEAAGKATEAVKETAEKAKEAAAGAAEKAKEAAAGGSDKGASLYKKCAGCHGVDGKTKAMGKSEVIAGQSAEDLVKKITEYKAGTRNVAGMGTLMKGQVSGLSDEDIKALADYISKLK